MCAFVGVVCAGKEAESSTGKIRCFPILIRTAQHGGLGEAARLRPDTASKTRDTNTQRWKEHSNGSRGERRGRKGKNWGTLGLVWTCNLEFRAGRLQRNLGTRGEEESAAGTSSAGYQLHKPPPRFSAANNRARVCENRR
ncbi:hypothetical protein Baya_3008 [Bagarius yarrelli]|uniref:Uncharacterized protein n=1 Tax=Bagarius yarrelli TaxID=175774 RepID=A0A556TU64_BAGYA|nr:hypothetical protein Baya_3008 [Bagarius yarrelli]